MKKLLLMCAMVVFFSGIKVLSQPIEVQQASNTQIVDDTTASQQTSVEQKATEEQQTLEIPEEKGMHQVLKQKFIEGGVTWMTPILILLILGLSISIERIIYLNLATINTEKFLTELENTLNTKGVNEAKEYARNVKGPVASICYQALDRYNQGLEAIEKSIVSYGSVQSTNLEKGLSWLSMVIALAPMLGFLGTVVGMVQAFDAIEAAGDISPTIVAGGMKVALITTVFGLIVAIIVQIFYNYIVNKIDGLVLKMEEASVSIMDILVHYSEKNKQ
ncbi:MAG: MotA/TolQ/ExbB proton channel family protein [Bacteroidales bacterium]|nr:MotA/TolQ/ExbB proton channel family protein [Bacteroidales bacterium]